MKNILIKTFCTIFLLSCPVISSIIVAYNAGCLPYTYDLNNRAIILLGLDHHGWTDFGGTSEYKESTAQTAAREFSEESLYQFYKHKSEVENKLNQLSPIKHPNWNYYLYLLYVPFKSSKALREAKAQLEKQYRLTGAEKKDFAWIYADDLLKNLMIGEKTIRTAGGRYIQLYNALFTLLQTKEGQEKLQAIILRK